MSGPPLPRPTRHYPDSGEVLLDYLDHFRETAIATVSSMPEPARGTSRLPSGWTPLELLNHLRHMEQRWFVWGFAGSTVPEPWADSTDGRWRVPDGHTGEDLAAQLREQGLRTTDIVRTHALSDRGRPGPRWDGHPPAELGRVLLHVLQEYARHVGHLDIVAELAGDADVNQES